MEVKESDFDVVLCGNGTNKEFLNLVEESAESLLRQIKILKDAVRLAISDKSIKLYEGYDLKQLQMELINASCSLYSVINRKKSIERDLSSNNEETLGL